MNSDFLSNIELYYCPSSHFKYDEVLVSGEEFHHIINVMRHKSGDKIHITNGIGEIFSSTINEIKKDNLIANIEKVFQYEKKNSNVIFCVPKLKNPERFEFALEKSVELGITRFIIFDAKKSIVKGEKKERWNKILLSAMKQSLQSYLPELSVCKNISEIVNLNGEKIILEQNSENNLNDLVLDKDKDYYFIFGPEGGLDETEINLISSENHFKLTENRLRSETAVIHTASLLKR